MELNRNEFIRQLAGNIEETTPVYLIYDRFIEELNSSLNEDLINHRIDFFIPCVLHILDELIAGDLEEYGLPYVMISFEDRHQVWAILYSQMYAKYRGNKMAFKFRKTVEGRFSTIEPELFYSAVYLMVEAGRGRRSGFDGFVSTHSPKEPEADDGSCDPSQESHVVEADDPTGTNPSLSEEWVEAFLEEMRHLSTNSTNIIDRIALAYVRSSPSGTKLKFADIERFAEKFHKECITPWRANEGSWLVPLPELIRRHFKYNGKEFEQFFTIEK